MAIPFKGQPVEGNGQNKGLVRGSNSVPTLPSADVVQALAQRVDKEAMRMIPSLANEMAKDGWQAKLEIFRSDRAYHVAEDTLKGALESMARNNDWVQQFLAVHPDLEADGIEMRTEINALVKQQPRVAFVAYVGRYFQARVQRLDL